MIDAAKPGEVGVIVMEGTLDIAAMGNLMGTAATVRGMAGMVLDGAIRDIWDIRRMGLTVYARSATPRTAVGHYATVARNVPVECAGVTVRPGDIIVADEDGVVVVPQERAEEVLKKAQEIDDRERGMFPFIRRAQVDPEGDRALRPHLTMIAAVLLSLAAAFPVAIRVDAGQPLGELHPIWRFFGADEPNYAYMKDGQKLLGELGELQPGARSTSARTTC